MGCGDVSIASAAWRMTAFAQPIEPPIGSPVLPRVTGLHSNIASCAPASALNSSRSDWFLERLGCCFSFSTCQSAIAPSNARAPRQSIDQERSSRAVLAMAFRINPISFSMSAGLFPGDSRKPIKFNRQSGAATRHAIQRSSKLRDCRQTKSLFQRLRCITALLWVQIEDFQQAVCVPRNLVVHLRTRCGSAPHLCIWSHCTAHSKAWRRS